MRRITVPHFEVYVLTTPEDGHCMLHAIANAISPSYQTGMRNGRPVSRLTIVKEIRKELLDQLGRRNTQTGLSNYESIGDGSFAESARVNETTTPAYLKRVLSGSAQLGEEVKIVLEFFIEKNILIVNAATNRLYSKYGFKAALSSIVLYHTVLGKNEKGEEIGHFELIAVREAHEGGTYRKHFPSNHPFIRYLLQQ